MDYTQTNVLSMTGGTDFATIADLANYVDLTTNQTITSGIKSFTALPQSSATPTIANQLVNKNYVDGNFVTLTTGQTITGAKTFNVNVKLNNTRQLIFGTSSAANINYTIPNLYYDITGGGHYFFIGGSPNLYIDTDGVNIESGKRIYFNGKRCSIRDSGTQLISDVPTNNSHSFRVNNVEKFKISTDANGTILTFPSGIVMREYSSFNWFLHEIPFGFQYKWDIDGDTKLEVEPSEIRTSVRINMKNDSRVTWWEGYTNEAYLVKNTTTSTFDYAVATGYKHKFMINSVEQLNLDATNGATFAGDIRMKIFNNFYPDDAFTGGFLTGDNGGGFSFNADVGAGFNFYCNTIPSFTIESTKVIVPSNNVLQLGITGSSIGYSSSLNEIQYKVPTGKIHNFQVNGTQVLTLGDSAYGLRSENNVFILNNKWLYLDAFNDGIQCDASGNMNYRALATAKHKMFIGAGEICSVGAGGLQMGVSTLPTAFPRIYTDYTQANNIFGDGASQIYTCGGTGVHMFRRGTTDIAFLNQNGLNLITNSAGLYLGASNLFTIQHDPGGTAGQYLVPTGWVHNFQVGGVGVAQIRSSGFSSFQNNTALRLGGTSQIEIKHDTATSQIQYKSVGAYSHMFYLNNTDLFYEMRSDTFRALRGYQNKLGANGSYVSNNFNFSWSNPVGGALSVWIDTTRLGNMSIVSDYRLKENIVPARPVLERLCKIKMIEYEFKDISIFKKCGRSHGFIAHEVQELFPELSSIIHGEKDALTDDGLIQPQSVGGEMTNLYLSAIQELNVKCETQKAQIETQQTQMEAMQKQIDGLVLALSKIVSP